MQCPLGSRIGVNERQTIVVEQAGGQRDLTGILQLGPMTQDQPAEFHLAEKVGLKKRVDSIVLFERGDVCTAGIGHQNVHVSESIDHLVEMKPSSFRVSHIKRGYEYVRFGELTFGNGCRSMFLVIFQIRNLKKHQNNTFTHQCSCFWLASICGDLFPSRPVCSDTLPNGKPIVRQYRNWNRQARQPFLGKILCVVLKNESQINCGALGRSFRKHYCRQTYSDLVSKVWKTKA